MTYSFPFGSRARRVSVAFLRGVAIIRRVGRAKSVVIIRNLRSFNCEEIFARCGIDLEIEVVVDCCLTLWKGKGTGKMISF